MTNEEAKRRIEICRDFLANNYSDMGEPNFMAFDMAIKALEQQDTDLDGYSSRLWHNAYERGKADVEAEVLDAIKEIRDLFKQPAAYVPNYDAYRLCLNIVCKHMEVDE